VFCCKILVTHLHFPQKTDITEYALDALATSRVKHVHLIGRRGPLQAAFTIKELREMLKLKNCQTIWRETDFTGIADKLADLQRPRKRITELMLKSLEESKSGGSAAKTFQPIFFRAPAAIHSKDGSRVDALDLTVTKLVGDKAVATDASETLEAGLICRSIGYKSTSVDSDINFDEKAGCVQNIAGKFADQVLSIDFSERYSS
jgi:adrenodoxin-NADP+ reductase